MKYSVPKILSISDVLTLKEYEGKSFEDIPLKDLLKIAYNLGLDISKGYELLKGVHRNLRNKLDEGEYIISTERLDKAWIKSGYATSEALIHSEPDVSVRRDMAKSRNSGSSMFRAVGEN